MFINRIQRPSLYISCAMLLWGLISTLTGNTYNFTGIVLVRFFLGFVEAAFLPGALLIQSKWYTRKELTTRNAILFCGNIISNAFSALVGAGVLSNMQGVLGWAAWRWLFWIEGAVTMAVAITAAFVLPDLPHNSRGFTAEELEVAQLRMIEDVGEADEDGANAGVFDGLIMAVKDVKIYLMMITFTAYVVGLSFNAFFPTLTGTLGFEYIPTLLLSSPPWAFSCIVSLFNAWHADRTQEKVCHILIILFFNMKFKSATEANSAPSSGTLLVPSWAAWSDLSLVWQRITSLPDTWRCSCKHLLTRASSYSYVFHPNPNPMIY